MTSETTPAATERVPGRSWTIRLTGHADRTAAVTCSITGCRMPPRSRDLAGLRRFAAQHAAAHAKAATVRPNALCHCRARQCTAHGDTKVLCAGAVVLIVQHDPSIGQVWTVSEVCQACSPLIPHATLVATAVRARPATTATRPAAAVPSQAQARSVAPGGFSTVATFSETPGEPGTPRRGPRAASRRPRRPPGAGDRR
ncbi:hypothetical protein [Actinacidiphila glaucinigra]|uniref:hypothetical protein n=1 Tax=Actinacidiphila glaucinigra TaxID=235986 RepID=UPI002E301391|nr:hypothetical protein [Actinacidiphila glaucinigra]